MSYDIFILRRAQKELSQLSAQAFERVCDVIRALAKDPRASGCLKLTGRDGWRLRVGEYRVIYEIDDKKKVVTVLHIGHRRDIYR
jgi:mRNA interferase RelE/StbE